MTMRRDVNVMGGTVEVLQYDFAALKQTVENLQELLRLQQAYNDYIESLQKGVRVFSSILQILSAAVSIANVLSTLTMSSENLSIDTMHTEQFRFGGGGFGGGGDYPGGGSGGGGGGKLIDGQ